MDEVSSGVKRVRCSVGSWESVQCTSEKRTSDPVEQEGVGHRAEG